ncbi:hypothetical protein AB0G48_20720 [Streptomyces rubiginosohelvolus]|uniref:hypothetical protein n=1 Tax=Streptomyces rubiginosohelvolus TaxID=67362 RepID=UPI0033C2AF3F
MSRSAHRAARDLVGALRRQTARVGSETPSVRGADWRIAVVASVNTVANTVTTEDGIEARRWDCYRSPRVGDIIGITQSGGGSWGTWGRWATTDVAIGETVPARKSTSTGRASTTVLAADPHLTVMLTPGTYHLDAFLMYDGDAAADLKLGWDAPVGTTGAWWPGGADSSVAAQASLPRWGALSDIGVSSIPVGAIGAGTILACRPSGTVIITTAGVLALTWAQNVSSATQTILRGQSTLRLQRIA